ncbi:protein kinase domain-containing protein [Frankia sp. Cas3]|uniref:protein kinase domain-containing protein n=1 Tax=Frankia sp. Cas3 TaxID=3073926 RepID=UPI002AD45AE1|nr:protein kinase [Frankia sp. Cas3]
MLAPLAADDPRSVGPYRLHGRLGEGGMGVVYQGFAPDDTPVAIKFPHRNVAADPEFRARFRQEVTAARRVRGTFVAEVLDADVDAPRPWMATAYVDGVSLADAVRRRGRLDGNALMSLAVGLAEALVVIHDAGVVHRDLKPGNIIMAWDGPKVIDFGIARLSDATVNTKTGFSIGTIAWMAPEQLSGERAGPAADIFAWATCVAYAATGRHPFAAETPTASMARVLGGPPDLAGMPVAVASVISRALAKAPAERPTAADVVTGLTGHHIHGITESEQIATRLVRGGDAPPPANPYGLPQPSATRREAPWLGWQTPPPPGAGGYAGPPSTGFPPAPQPSDWQRPAQEELRTPQPPLPTASRAAPPAAPDVRGILDPPGPPQQGWFGRSVPMATPVLGVLLVAAVLTLIPSALRTPGLYRNRDVWDVFGEFGIAFLALPVALIALVAANRWGSGRDFASGCVVGLSVMSLAELGWTREIIHEPRRAGWWMIMIGAAVSMTVVLAWRGWTAGWSSGRWTAFVALAVGLGVVLFIPANPLWKAYVLSDQRSLIGTLVIGGMLLLASLLAPSGGATFLIAAVAAGVCALEMFQPRLMIYVVDSFAVVIGLVALGLLCDRRSDRFFLFAARATVAVALLRLKAPSFMLPISPRILAPLGGTNLNLPDVHLAAFAAIAVLALFGARARGPMLPMPGPWQPPPSAPPPYRVNGPYG